MDKFCIKATDGNIYSYSPLTLFNYGTKKLYIKNAANSTLIYPLTTDTSASEYCKFKIRVGNSVAYLATGVNTTYTSTNSVGETVNVYESVTTTISGTEPTYNYWTEYTYLHQWNQIENTTDYLDRVYFSTRITTGTLHTYTNSVSRESGYTYSSTNSKGNSYTLSNSQKVSVKTYTHKTYTTISNKTIPLLGFSRSITFNSSARSFSTKKASSMHRGTSIANTGNSTLKSWSRTTNVTASFEPLGGGSPDWFISEMRSWSQKTFSYTSNGAWDVLRVEYPNGDIYSTWWWATMVWKYSATYTTPILQGVISAPASLSAYLRVRTGDYKFSTEETLTSYTTKSTWKISSTRSSGFTRTSTTKEGTVVDHSTLALTDLNVSSTYTKQSKVSNRSDYYKYNANWTITNTTTQIYYEEELYFTNRSDLTSIYNLVDSKQTYSTNSRNKTVNTTLSTWTNRLLTHNINI